MHARTHTHTHAQAHTHASTLTHTYTHTRMHAHTHVGRYLGEVEEGGFGLLGPRVPGEHPQQQRKQGVGKGHRQVILILLQVLHCNTCIQFLQQNSRGLVQPTVIFKCCMATEASIFAATQQGFCKTHFPIILMFHQMLPGQHLFSCLVRQVAKNELSLATHQHANATCTNTLHVKTSCGSLQAGGHSIESKLQLLCMDGEYPSL